ncbi:MAG: hypothetical protein IIB41_06935 [Candidatus Marinimicrobia bacterium]|nr:hypothetical protein [Candidatus Neomarinimicrobiota bacterium]
MIFLGIDAGGTKTTAVAADLNGEQIRTAQGAPGAISAIGVSGVNSLITELLRELDLYDSLDGLQAATFGFSGVGRADVKEKVENEIEKIGVNNFKLITDAELLHYSAFGESDGILLEAGTGAVCISGNINALTQIGGWGFLLGDEGGGYQIGRDAIRKTLAEYDKNLSVSNLSIEIMKFYGAKKRGELIDVVYSADNNQKIISSSAYKVCEMAKQGDTDAQTIVEDAATHLSALLQTALVKYATDDLIKIACAGSILSEDSPVLDLFIKKVDKFGYNFEFIDIPIEPAAAGVLYAVNSAGEDATEQLLNSLKGITV